MGIYVLLDDRVNVGKIEKGNHWMGFILKNDGNLIPSLKISTKTMQCINFGKNYMLTCHDQSCISRPLHSYRNAFCKKSKEFDHVEIDHRAA